ncbi:MAG: peptidylprolyl isomerase [Planctomycetota bacterium]|jgi:hypothetical protein|nr:peptidylprolyl isomerase [Planctomycetota bacterium]
MLAALLLCLPVATAASPQQAPELSQDVVAVWNGGSVNTKQFDLFLGKHAHRQQQGNEALAHMLQLQLVEFEAAEAGLTVSPVAVDARIEDARVQIEAAGQDLDTILASRQLSKKEFRKLIADSLLHEKLVRKSNKLADDAEVTAEMLTGWSQERIASLLEAAAIAPAGMALDVAPYHITLEELGTTVRRTMGDRDLQDRVDQLVLGLTLPQWAQQQKLVLTDVTLHEEIEWRRKRVEENPAYGGVSYEDLLKSRGATIESVLESEELRMAGYMRLLSEQRFPDLWFAELSNDQKLELDSMFGPSRMVGWILLHATEEKADELDLDFDEAAAELKLLSERIRSTTDFHQIAADYSEHEVTRRRDGMLGRIHRSEEGVPQALCDAAFAVDKPGIYGPVKIVDPNPFAPTSGMALILVQDFDPGPSPEEFRALVRRGQHRDLRKQFLAEIGLRSHWSK